jgi:hypothetical protein
VSVSLPIHKNQLVTSVCASDILREFEGSWRLQLSPNTQISRSAATKTSDTSASSESKPGQERQPMFQPQTRSSHFRPSKSMVPPAQDILTKSEPTADVTFDITYPPPAAARYSIPPAAQYDIGSNVQYDVPLRAQHDTSCARQYDLPHTAQYMPIPECQLAHLLSTHDPPPTVGTSGVILNSYSSHSHLTACQTEMYGGPPGPSMTSRPDLSYEHMQYSTQYPVQTRNESMQQPAAFIPVYQRPQSYFPEHGYPSIDAAMQHGVRTSASYRPGPSYTNAFSMNSPGVDVGSAAIPGLGIFPPGGWVLALIEDRSNGGNISGGGMGGPLDVTGGRPPKPLVISI